MNCVWATTQSAVYVAMKHIFPEVPINAGCFAPLRIPAPSGRSSMLSILARSPAARPGRQRIMEAVFGAMGQAMPERMFASPAGTSGNLALGGWDPDRGSGYIMYFFSGGAYSGWWETDGLTNGCSSVGISKTQPVEILEAALPAAIRGVRATRGSGGAGRHRGGGINYRVRMLRGEGRLPSSWTTGELGHPD